MSDSSEILNRMSYYMRPHNLCICKGVSEAAVREAVKVKGAMTFQEVQRLTGCSTGCGTCESRIREFISKVQHNEIK